MEANYDKHSTLQESVRVIKEIRDNMQDMEALVRVTYAFARMLELAESGKSGKDEWAEIAIEDLLVPLLILRRALSRSKDSKTLLRLIVDGLKQIVVSPVVLTGVLGNAALFGGSTVETIMVERGMIKNGKTRRVDLKGKVKKPQTKKPQAKKPQSKKSDAKKPTPTKTVKRKSTSRRSQASKRNSSQTSKTSKRKSTASPKRILRRSKRIAAKNMYSAHVNEKDDVLAQAVNTLKQVTKHPEKILPKALDSVDKAFPGLNLKKTIGEGADALGTPVSALAHTYVLDDPTLTQRLVAQGLTASMRPRKSQ